MIEAVVLAFSILFQFVAAVLALRLIRITGKYPAWTLIAAAIFLMTIRRSITFGRLISRDMSYSPDLLAELVALAISILMVLGFARIAPLFLAIKDSQTKIEGSEAQIRALNQRILHMLMVVSHDVRSPLISAVATLKLLSKGIYGTIDESVQNTLHELQERITRLIGTAEECLGKTFVINGALDGERKELDLRENIIDPVLDELSSEIAEHDIYIDNRLGGIPAKRIPIKANSVWLRIVVRNLFRNAIKHGGRGCTIAFGFEDQDSYYQCNVYNSGRPVPEECRERLFTKFCRIESNVNGHEEGLGLGLYLVKEIIEKYGGRIWYEAKDNGSNFVFTLPRD